MKSKYDAILLLGLKLNADGTPKHELTLRIETAADCWKKRLAPLIIPCGGQTPDTPVSEAAVMRDALVALGVPESAIHMEDRSLITVENLLNAREMLGKKHPRVLIVTSDYHLPRAMALANDQGLEAAGRGSPCKPEYWIKNHAREALSWVKYWMQKVFG